MTQGLQNYYIICFCSDLSNRERIKKIAPKRINHFCWNNVYYSHSAEEHFMSFMGTVNTYKTRVFSMYYTLFMVSTRSRLRFGIAFGIGVGINHLGLLLIILPPIMIPVFHFHHFHRSAYSNLRLVVGGRSNHVRGSPLFYIKRLLKSIDSFHKISCTYLAWNCNVAFLVQFFV